MAFGDIRRPATSTLSPQLKESKDWSTTENIFIEGENLEVLKLLQKKYANPGKIKMIYIDPPYNTGKDFIYTDNFTENKNDYYERTGQGCGGIKLTSNLESNGRYHSDWLTMMYPRLFLARNLLRNDGVIFVSIDDNEVANLRMIMDEIFGEENFVENYIWESTFRPDNSSKLERENAQYVLLYSKNRTALTRLNGQGKKTEGLPSLTKNSMNISILQFPEMVVKTNIKDGTYLAGSRESGYELLDDVVVSEGIIKNKFRLSGRMIWGQKYLDDQLENGTEIIIKNESFVPYSKKKEDGQLAPTTLIPNKVVGDVLAARAELKSLFDEAIFDYPKPVSLIKYLVGYMDADEDDTVLDFFSGSGTTAHAVIDLNAEDGGNRKWICVQVPEGTGDDSEACKAGYKTISAISRERIRRAGEKIRQGATLNLQKGRSLADLDTGFKAFSLSPSNYSEWNVLNDKDDEETLKKQAQLFVEQPLVAGYDEQSVVYEILLKEGFDLNSKVEEIKKGGVAYYQVTDGDTEMAITFAKKLTKDQVESLGLQKDTTFVCLDSALDDTTKVNIVMGLMVKTI